MTSFSNRLKNIIADQFGATIVEQTLEKAIVAARDRANHQGTTFYDPMVMFMGQEWAQKGTSVLGAAELRMMSRNPIIRAILQTRLNQLSAFCSPARDDYDLGFYICSDDPEAMKDRKKIQEITAWIYNCGLPGYGEENLENLVRKIMSDSLVLDQCCAEISPRLNGLPAYTVAVDAATIRRLKPSLDYYLPSAGHEPYYCQVIDEQVKATYTREQMMFGVRNPQTDIRAAGYGSPELESLIRTVTTILAVERYNASLLAQGGTRKGILTIKGSANQQQVDSFKRDFREAIRNASAYWKPPVLQVGMESGVDWLNLDQSNRDIEYASLLEFLIRQACAVYLMDPSEINWSTAGSGVTTNFESRNDLKQKASKDRGLRPLLTFLANLLTINLVQKLDPRYRLAFCGLDNDRLQDQETRQKEVTLYKTVNEIRLELGLKEILGGDVILNPNFLGEADDRYYKIEE